MACVAMPSPTPFFEGTEKRIEIDFRGDGDLREASKSSWEDVVKLSATQILNSKRTEGFVSFLLSESSLIVYSHKLIIKTCGRTVPLSAVPKILEIGREQGLSLEWLCYSRKNFLAPEEQPHEHQSMEAEVALCRKVCQNVGDAYVLGPLTGEHWLYYDALYLQADYMMRGDFTIDVMMYDLPKDVQQVFHTNEPEGSRAGALEMTKLSGLSTVAASMGAEVDDYCFDKCGYSCNMHSGTSYAMVHVTPQASCSYASFETNFGSVRPGRPDDPDLEKRLNELLSKVFDVFRPGRLTVTLLIDQGALAYIGSSPFSAADQRYRRRSFVRTELEKDYIATMINFDCSEGSPKAVQGGDALKRRRLDAPVSGPAE